MSSPDIANLINLDEDGLNRAPKFAASIGRGSNNNLFTTYVKNNKVKLRCSARQGNNMSAEVDILTVPGTVKLLKIGAKGDIAVVVAVEDIGTKLVVKGSTGTISTSADPQGHVISTFTHQECPSKDLAGNFSDVLDLAIRINDDGTSDDYVFTKGVGGADVAHVGHHPRAP